MSKIEEFQSRLNNAYDEAHTQYIRALRAANAEAEAFWLKSRTGIRELQMLFIDAKAEAQQWGIDAYGYNLKQYRANA